MDALPPHPPRPRLVFRVGVVGRRFARHGIVPDDRLDTRVDEVLRCVANAVKAVGSSSGDAYAAGAPVLRVVSSLAEGADQLVARRAVAQGYELQCPLPAPEAEYLGSFATTDPGSGAAAGFESVLREAATGGRHVGLLEIDDDARRADADAAYLACARIVAGQSDLLVALWDGTPDTSECGTLTSVDFALRNRIPVLWIDPRPPHGRRWLWEPDHRPRVRQGSRTVPADDVTALAKDVERVVQKTLLPPEPVRRAGHGGPEESRREDYAGERRHRRNLAFWWKAFRNLLSARTASELAGAFRVRLGAKAPETVDSPDWRPRTEWAGGVDAAPPTAMDPVQAVLQPHFGWADTLADRYADRYRSSFVVIYGAAVLAAMLVLGCLVSGWGGKPPGHHVEMACKAAEAVLIGGVLLLLWLGKAQRWHSRWIDYRLLAERIRELRFLAGTGGARPLARHLSFDGHLARYGDPDATWMAWWARALEREVGLVPARVDRDYLLRLARHVREALVGEQRRYHHANAERMERINHRLHVLGLTMFVATFLLCLGHLVLLVRHVELDRAVVQVLLGVGAAVPLVGGALTGLRDQGEFQRIAVRSEAMEDLMGQFDGRLEELETRLQAGEADAEEVFALVQEVTRSMVHENLGWRVILLDRPLREA